MRVVRNAISLNPVDQGLMDFAGDFQQCLHT